MSRPDRCPSEHNVQDGEAEYHFYCDRIAGHPGIHEADDLPYGSGLRRLWSDAAAEEQVGGNHYTKFKIQPWAVIDEYGLDFYEGSALKYLLRHRHKNGVEDLKKCRHYLDRLIERAESDAGDAKS